MYRAQDQEVKRRVAHLSLSLPLSAHTEIPLRRCPRRSCVEDGALGLTAVNCWDGIAFHEAPREQAIELSAFGADSERVRGECQEAADARARHLSSTARQRTRGMDVDVEETHLCAVAHAYLRSPPCSLLSVTALQLFLDREKPAAASTNLELAHRKILRRGLKQLRELTPARRSRY